MDGETEFKHFLKKIEDLQNLWTDLTKMGPGGGPTTWVPNTRPTTTCVTYVYPTKITPLGG